MAIVKTNDLLREKFSKDMISKIQKVGELVVALQEKNESIEWNKITTKEEYIKCTSMLRSYNQSMADLNIVFPWDADNSFCLPYLTDFKTVDFVEFETDVINKNIEETQKKHDLYRERWEWEVVRYFQSSIYRVSFYIMPNKGMGKMGYIAFRRRDGKAIDSWRDKQLIKDIICGTKTEAVELYPSWHRMVDSCNQYHLWFKPNGSHFGFGMNYSDFCMDNEQEKVRNKMLNEQTGSDATQELRKNEHIYNADIFPNFGLLGQWWKGNLND